MLACSPNGCSLAFPPSPAFSPPPNSCTAAQQPCSVAAPLPQTPSPFILSDTIYRPFCPWPYAYIDWNKTCRSLSKPSPAVRHPATMSERDLACMACITRLVNMPKSEVGNSVRAPAPASLFPAPGGTCSAGDSEGSTGCRLKGGM